MSVDSWLAHPHTWMQVNHTQDSWYKCDLFLFQIQYKLSSYLHLYVSPAVTMLG